jgi:hypothetical protein
MSKRWKLVGCGYYLSITCDDICIAKVFPYDGATNPAYIAAGAQLIVDTMNRELDRIARRHRVELAK